MAANSRWGIELHPEFPVNHWALAAASLEMSNFELTITELNLAVECSGRATLFLAMLAETHAVAGNRDEARRMLEQLLENSAQEYVTPYMIGRIYAALDQKDEAFRWLETGYRERAAWMPFLKVDPRMDCLRSDPRFEGLLRRMNFPPVVVD